MIEDFHQFQERTEQIREAAGSILFDSRPDWFNTSIGVAEKATYANPGEQAKRGGVISNRKDKWFFLHSTNLCNLTGPGFMLTTDMLLFLYQNGDDQKP